MTDEELVKRLRDDVNGEHDMTPHGADVLQAVARIEALTKERDQHWDSFVHWHKQADDLTGQLAAARQDAKEAEVYAEELEAKLEKAVEGQKIKALEQILEERGAVFDAMVDAAEDAAGKDVSFNVVVGRALRAAIAAVSETHKIKGESQDGMV